MDNTSPHPVRQPRTHTNDTTGDTANDTATTAISHERGAGAMTTMIDIQTATGTDDTAEVLARTAGNFRAAYWDAVDRAAAIESSGMATAEEVAAASEEVARLLTSWSDADAAFREYFLELSRSHWATGVVFAPVEEYGREWARVCGVDC